MGQENGKNCYEKGQGYFQQQLALYHWRADQAVNGSIAKVHFTSKGRLENKKHLQSFVQQQLMNNNYVDIGEIAGFRKEEWWRKDEQVMTFQSYTTNLTPFEEILSLEDTLYVMGVLLSGGEAIFRKFGRMVVDSDCCFLTERGEVRIWINPNPSLNEFQEHTTLQTSERVVIGDIVRQCELFACDGTAFMHFIRHLDMFREKDPLRNVNFSSVRRFINGYVYAHQLVLPQDLGHLLTRTKSRSSYHSTHQRNSSLAEMFQPMGAQYPAQMITNARMTPQLAGKQGGSQEPYRPSLASSGSQSVLGSSSNSDSRNIEFYRPDHPFEKKLSTLDLNSTKCQKRSLNRSDVVSRHSKKASVSSSFSKKDRPSPLQIFNVARTPKENMAKTRSGLQSTTGESYLGHSKDSSGLSVLKYSKIMHSTSTTNLFDSNQEGPRMAKKQKVVFFDDEKSTGLGTRHGTEKNQHSRQPSFDENSSSLFVSPANEPANGEMRANQLYKNQKLAEMEAISESAQSDEMQSYMGPDISTKGQISPSQLLGRQVSGLVENNDLHMFQSRGSFLSFQNSSSSEYKGALLGMCHSAKMMSIPTSKRLERGSRR